MLEAHLSEPITWWKIFPNLLYLKLARDRMIFSLDLPGWDSVYLILYPHLCGDNINIDPALIGLLWVVINPNRKRSLNLKQSDRKLENRVALASDTRRHRPWHRLCGGKGWEKILLEKHKDGLDLEILGLQSLDEVRCQQLMRGKDVRNLFCVH